ncbi:hypothetical protein X970_10055 [Pseudomonas monteilii SB3101]|uniref:Uncharacterized protein n=1 Tax=Pseudomonas monteilii SB3101 TaxID=1435058 RepID=V9V819_9PSED|nr:hypothetical protein X969_10395 [Pseudomonas monteilii SB3078]AHC91061.1 hypothetical protein X970_10055 [Pseudomonas monteilii SB3101]
MGMVSYQVELISKIKLEESGMRTLGWLMTAVGYAGLSGMLAMIGAAALGFHNLTARC